MCMCSLVLSIFVLIKTIVKRKLIKNFHWMSKTTNLYCVRLRNEWRWIQWTVENAVTKVECSLNRWKWTCTQPVISLYVFFFWTPSNFWFRGAVNKWTFTWATTRWGYAVWIRSLEIRPIWSIVASTVHYAHRYLCCK